MNTRTLVSTLFIALACCSCNSQSAGVKNLNPDAFEKGISQSNAQLVDVRTPEEYKEKHIKGAENIGIKDTDFEKRMNELDKSKPLYMYCLAGGRSKKAAEWAAGHGFKEVYNLEAGINSWMAASKPVVTETGAPPAEGMSMDDYLNHIKQGDKLVLVDFNAVWCGPCKVIKPYVLKTVKAHSDKVTLFDIDIDKNPLVAKNMNIQGIPLLILYKNGKEVWRNLGVIEEKELMATVKQYLK